ncbi:stemmadenine O-acetyltransferase-like [Quercus robur]|uniref:stemmadenine O-acetyltransferase-like n=1 Tax=Quercus robur TaxID=38942 RepID=UPI00216141F3|nr:stemmadenine O-acetyltransferase-like [Quercus robur]
MKLEVELISNENIKPSSPTRTHLRYYQLSFLDQIFPLMYVPFLFFYSQNDAYSKISTNPAKSFSNVLKKSLSDVLTRYYPLAGRIRDNLVVDCNDEGVLYREAQVKCELSDIVTNPNPAEFKKFLPCNIDDTHHFAFAVQVNYFTCGGITIGACISHKIADGTSFIMFMKTWAATARGDSNIYPQFQASTLFPPTSTLSGFQPENSMIKEKLVLKRFVFSSTSVVALREKYGESSDLECPLHPSRVEALSVFLWSRYVAATQANIGPKKLNMVLFAVNLRTRMDPPLPRNSFGNIFRLATVLLSSEERSGLVGKVRAAIRKIDNEYVKKLQDHAQHLNFLKEASGKVLTEDVVPFNFSSWCRFPMYEVDFGWGNPMWIGLVSLPFKNVVVFIDTKSGDGIEAWVNLKEEDMTKFEGDTELLAYASTTSLSNA